MNLELNWVGIGRHDVIFGQEEANDVRKLFKHFWASENPYLAREVKYKPLVQLIGSLDI